MRCCNGCDPLRDVSIPKTFSKTCMVSSLHGDPEPRCEGVVNPTMPIKDPDNQTSMLSDNVASTRPQTLEPRIFSLNFPHALPYESFRIATPKMPIKHTERLTSMLSDKQARNQPLKLQGARTPDGVKLYGTCCRRVCFSSLPYAGNSAA